ncbi:hypothetical protein ASG14_07445 [Pedobacter sp. Leaf194]|nr:hypothetical protein ASG14_07445 [Pedobacter sp. Leaf194]
MFSLLWKFNFLPDYTVPIIILIGIITTVIKQILSFFIVGIKKDLRKILARHSHNFTTNANARFHTAFGEEFWAEITKKTTEGRSRKLLSLERVPTLVGSKMSFCIQKYLVALSVKAQHSELGCANVNFKYLN